jgi:endonuclease/exonuclease/phosphatase family metal-dependent hydrolase
MTYNILRGGRDDGGDARLGQICELVRRVAPDVLLLEECNDFERDGFRTFHRVERELGLRGLFAPASSGYHLALFVRGAQPIEVRVLDRELHHSAIAATLELAGQRFTVIGAHLCPFSGEVRAAEAQQLSRFFAEGDVFLLGDLNSISPRDAPGLRREAWLPRRRLRHELAGTGGELDTRAVAAIEACGLVDTVHARGAGSPTIQTRLCPEHRDYQIRIDYIFASPPAAERVTRAERIDGALADAASDHYPLIVDVDG